MFAFWSARCLRNESYDRPVAEKGFCPICYFCLLLRCCFPCLLLLLLFSSSLGADFFFLGLFL